MTSPAIRLLRPYRGALLGLVAIVTLSAAAEAVGLVLLSSLLSTIVPGGTAPNTGPIREFQRIVAGSPGGTLAIVGVVYVGKSLLALWTTYASFSMALRMADDWSLRLLRGYLTTPLGRLARQQGSMLQMVLSETGIVGGGLATGGLLAQNAFSAASVYVALLVLSPVLTLGLTVIAAVAIAAVLVLSRYARDISSRRIWVADDAFNYVAETVSALKQLRLFGLEVEAERRVGEHLVKARRLQRTSSVISSTPRLIIEVIFLVGLATVFGVFVPALGASAAVADIGLVVAATFRLLPSLSASAGTWVQLQQTWPGLQRIAAELAYLEDGGPRDRPSGRPATFTDRIDLEDVRFAYPGREQALAGVTLEIPRGAFIGIVGPSGSGKSTIVDLLCAFYQPDRGRIVLDGVELADIDALAWRRTLGVVAQDNFLFSGTLRENLLLLRPTADAAALQRVVSLVGADGFIQDLPEGYDTRLGERGVRLSGGQRQRLALARVLLRSPEVLILDEATSALDVTSDERIFEDLERLRGAITMIVVTHRLSSVRRADHIYVLSDGRVVEHGTHVELLSRDGAYAGMWQAISIDDGGDREARADA